MTSREQLFKELCGFMGEGSPKYFTTLPSLVAIGLVVAEI